MGTEDQFMCCYFCRVAENAHSLVGDAVGQQLKLIIHFGRDIALALFDTVQHEVSSFAIRLLQHESIAEVLHSLRLEHGRPESSMRLTISHSFLQYCRLQRKAL